MDCCGGSALFGSAVCAAADVEKAAVAGLAGHCAQRGAGHPLLLPPLCPGGDAALAVVPLGRRQPAGNSLLLEGRRRHGGPVDWPRGGGDRAGPAAALGGGDRPAEAGPAGGEKRAMTEEVPKGEEASWS